MALVTQGVPAQGRLGPLSLASLSAARTERLEGLGASGKHSHPPLPLLRGCPRLSASFRGPCPLGSPVFIQFCSAVAVGWVWRAGMGHGRWPGCGRPAAWWSPTARRRPEGIGQYRGGGWVPKDELRVLQVRATPGLTPLHPDSV